ncbi:amino acid permease [Schaalia meyeri]|nr:amino acid permease [Schaalia meyeri]
MMALGLAIGAGFFLGTGSAIHQAGPAVIVSYLLAAGIVVSVMLALAELASSLPTTGSFSSYAEAGIGRWAGFTIGWLYWVMLIMVTGIEVTGAATIFVDWFPAVPQWVVALVIVVVIGGINLLAAGQYGEIEAWLSMVKVVAIVAFLCVGAWLVAQAAVAGPAPGREGIWQNIIGHGGFAPSGIPGIAVGLLAVITSFGGLEIVTIAAAEAEDPSRAMAGAIRSVITRILVFYIGSVILLIALLRWDSDEMKTNAFAAVLSMAGVPAVGTVMNVIIFMALISAFSANIYASSRMAYSLSARDMGWRWLLGARALASGRVGPSAQAVLEGGDEAFAAEMAGDMEAGRTPKRAVGLVVVLALLAVWGNWYLPGGILTILINAIGMVLLIVWTFIIISLMRLHSSLERSGSLVIRMPGWPWLPWVVLVGLGGVGVLMLMSAEGRAQLVSMGALTLIIVCIYFVRQLVRARSRA